MKWYSASATLNKHPKFLRFKLLAKMRSEKEALGQLHMFFSWVATYAEQGNLSTYSARELASGCGWSGDPQHLVQSLTGSGFLNGDMTVHDWLDWNWPIIGNRKRQQAHRDKALMEMGIDTSNVPHNVMVTLPKCGRNVTVTATVHDRTVHDLPTVPTTPPTPPKGKVWRDDLEDFQRLWNLLPDDFHRVNISSWGKASTRLRHFRARLADPGWKEDYPKAITRLAEIPKGVWPRGASGKGLAGQPWTCTVDFFLRPDSVARILEIDPSQQRRDIYGRPLIARDTSKFAALVIHKVSNE